jgi:hypothetical protein
LLFAEDAFFGKTTPDESHTGRLRVAGFDLTTNLKSRTNQRR